MINEQYQYYNLSLIHNIPLGSETGLEPEPVLESDEEMNDPSKSSNCAAYVSFSTSKRYLILLLNSCKGVAI